MKNGSHAGWWSVLVDASVGMGRLHQPTCLVKLPRDINMFRVIYDRENLYVDLQLKVRGKWRQCLSAWELPPCYEMAVCKPTFAIVFAKTVLQQMGVRQLTQKAPGQFTNVAPHNI